MILMEFYIVYRDDASHKEQTDQHDSQSKGTSFSRNPDPGWDDSCPKDKGEGDSERNCDIPDIGRADSRKSRETRGEKAAGQNGLQEQNGDDPSPADHP